MDTTATVSSTTTTANPTTTTAAPVLSHGNELMLLAFLVVGMLVAGVIVIVGRKRLTSGSDASGSLIRSWIAISLVMGLLIFGATALLIGDSTLRSTLFGGLIASVSAAIAFYFSSQGASDAIAAAANIGQTPIAPTAFSMESPAQPKLNEPYTYTFAANGAPTPTYSVRDGSPPQGLRLAPDGTLSGTVTHPGAATFTVRAVNVAGHVDSNAITLTPQ